MNLNHVKAMILRHLYNYRHSYDKLVDSFYWPAMDIFIWGLTSAWIRSQTNIPDLVLILLSGLVFWQIVWRSQYEFTVNLLEEMWNQNMVSLFASPLTVMEWVMSAIILGLIKMILSVGFAMLLVWCIYAVKLWSNGFTLIPPAIILIMSGWWIGLWVSGFIVRFGMRIQTLAWSGVYLLAPFSAIYYPISSLPAWGQQIAYFVPMSHVFTYMRRLLAYQPVSLTSLLMPLIQTVVLVILSAFWFRASVESSKKTGLSRLE